MCWCHLCDLRQEKEPVGPPEAIHQQGGTLGDLGHPSDVTRCPSPAVEIVWVVSHPLLLPWYLEQGETSLDPSEGTFEPSVLDVCLSHIQRPPGSS